MEKIKEYAVVSCDKNDLIKQCQKFINEGWQPFGGISTAYCTRKLKTGQLEEYLHYSQAFVR